MNAETFRALELLADDLDHAAAMLKRVVLDPDNEHGKELIGRIARRLRIVCGELAELTDRLA